MGASRKRLFSGREEEETVWKGCRETALAANIILLVMCHVQQSLRTGFSEACSVCLTVRSHWKE